MTYSIAQLQVALDAATHNEPIHRAEGNIEQADHCLAVAKDYQEAISVLNVYQSVAPAVGAAIDKFVARGS